MKDLSGYLHLLREITFSDFKLRYKNSMMGFLWVILEPLAMMSIMYIIFARIVRIQIENYQLFLLLGLVQWQLFSRGTNGGIKALSGRSDILKKIYFPRRIMVLSVCLTTLMMTGFEIAIFLAMGFVFGLQFHLGLLWLVPMFVLEFLLIYSLGLLMAPLNLRLSDLSNLWGIVLRMGFYLSPVLYSVDFIPEAYRKLYLLNPMASLIHTSRHFVFPEASYQGHFHITLLTIAVLFVAGQLVFRWMEPRLGDYV